jgi:hypothetical protein
MGSSEHVAVFAFWCPLSTLSRPVAASSLIWSPAAREAGLATGVRSFLLLWVFHHTFRTGCVKFLLVDFLLVDGSIIVGIDTKSSRCKERRLPALAYRPWAPLCSKSRCTGQASELPRVDRLTSYSVGGL